LLNGVSDAKPKPVVPTAKPSTAAAPRQDSGSDIDTDPFFDDLMKKDTTL